MVIVIAEIHLHPGTRESFLREFREIVPQVRAEDGCLEYGPAVDCETAIAAQVPLRPDVVTVVEKWESVDALEAHLVAPHMMAYRPKVREFVRESRLHILEPA